ncbi:PTS system galactitol-specific EIIC component [Propionicimonas sp. T2.31MG-18]|uniref:PTS galactitol transporter subunit IIC n=1 Tax=Propionicimonas sp. T2.31MG-18 TaxID=3157620 RepID=UPI0035E9B5F9
MQEVLAAISQYITTLGPTVVLPIIITIFGLVLGLSFSKAFRAGVTIGVGFIGINLVIGLLGGQVGPAAKAMAENFGVHLSTVDVGWPSSAAIAFGSSIGAVIIPLGLVVNVVLLFTGLTRTLDIDLWNYWHSALIGALVAALTGDFWLGILAAAIHLAIILAMADITAPVVQKYFKLPDISFPHGTSAAYGLLAMPLDWVFERIPGLNKLDATPEGIQKRFGLFGETLMLGLLLGLVIGVLAFPFRNPATDIVSILTLAMSLAAAMFLLPRMVGILMEGLMPISEAARTFVQKRFPGRQFYIGLDSAVAVGQPAVIATSLILVPVTLLLALALAPLGNQVLPLVDLATIPFIVAIMVAVFRGNIVRSIIGGGILIGMGLFIATWIAPAFTKVAVASGFELGEGQTVISSLVDGANPLTGLFMWASSGGAAGIVAISVAGLGFVVGTKVVLDRRARAQAAQREVADAAA